jgi:hypothetical protein
MDYKQAIYYLEQAQEFSELYGQTINQYRLLFELTYSHYRVGNIDDSIECSHKYLNAGTLTQKLT